MPFDFRLKIFAISITNFVFCFIWEKYFLNKLLRRLIMKIKSKLKVKSSKTFNAIDQQIKEDNWPFNYSDLNDRESPSKDCIAFKGFNRFASEDRL